jgi:CBS domain-containing protein
LVPKGQVNPMMIVRDVMTYPVWSVRATTPLRDVAELLIENKISGAPVVDANGAVLGIVSEADLLIKEQGPEAVRHRRLARFFGESKSSLDQIAKLEAVTAGEAMTAPALTISSGRRISEAAALMTARKVNRLPVVDDGQLVGIVTRSDLVRAYIRSDEELARTIREDVLLQTLWLDPVLFNVHVENGIASVSGRVERRSTAEMIDRTVGMVPGILDARVNVEWSVDDSHMQPASMDLIFPFGPH